MTEPSEGKKIEVGDWVLTSDSGNKKYDNRVCQVDYIAGSEVYLTPPSEWEEDESWRFDISEVGLVESAPGPSENVKGAATPERLDELTQIASGIPFVEELKALHDPISPNHYDYPGGVQVIDLTRHMDFLLGNVVKYVARAGRKGNRLEDLQKAAQYLAWAIEDEETK